MWLDDRAEGEPQQQEWPTWYRIGALVGARRAEGSPGWEWVTYQYNYVVLPHDVSALPR